MCGGDSKLDRRASMELLKQETLAHEQGLFSSAHLFAERGTPQIMVGMLIRKGGSTSAR